MTAFSIRFYLLISPFFRESPPCPPFYTFILLYPPVWEFSPRRVSLFSVPSRLDALSTALPYSSANLAFSPPTVSISYFLSSGIFSSLSPLDVLYAFYDVAILLRNFPASQFAMVSTGLTTPAHPLYPFSPLPTPPFSMDHPVLKRAPLALRPSFDADLSLPNFSLGPSRSLSPATPPLLSDPRFFFF